MKKILLTSLIATGLTSLASLSFAADFSDFATVRKVEPQYSNVNRPTQKCSVDTVEETTPGHENNHGGAIVGGLAGGLLGNQVSRGHSRDGGTVVGAVLGAVVGDSVDRNSYTPPQTTVKDVQHCYLQDNYVQTITNYKITYDYKGRTESFMSPVAPSDSRLRLNVSINPVVDSYTPPTGYVTPAQPAYPSYVR